MYKRKRLYSSLTFIFIVNFNFSFCQKEDDKLLQNIQWWEVSHYFTNILNNGLFARSFQEKLNEDFDWSTHEIDTIKVLDERQERVDTLFKQTIQGVKKLRDAIVANFDDFKPSKAENHCCLIRKESHIESGCFYGKDRDKESLLANPPEKVIKQIQDIITVYNDESFLYFSFTDGGVYEYTSSRGQLDDKRCFDYNPHTRPWYELASSPVARDIVLLVDFEKIQNKDLALKTGKSIIETLGQDDRIAVVLKSNLIHNIKNARHVEFGAWLLGTTRNKEKLSALLDDTAKIKNLSNFTTDRVGNDEQNSEYPELIIQRKAEMIFVHITNGSEGFCFTPSPRKKGNYFDPTLFITYVIGNKTLTHCANITQKQNFINILKGQDLYNDTTGRNKFSSFFKWSEYLTSSRFNLDPENDIRITLPYKSYFDRGMLITLTLPIVVNRRFKGVVAKDIRNWISLDHISRHEVSTDSYGFLIDQNGRTLFHPLLPSPYYCIQESCTDSPTFDLISNLEQNEPVQNILQSMVKLERGIKRVEGYYVQSTGHSLRHESNPVTVVKRKMVYAWIPLVTVKLSLCTVIPLHNDKVYGVTYQCTKGEKCKLDFKYHLEIQKEQRQNCSYFGADVLKDEGLVKFSPWAFQNPIRYLNQQNVSDDPLMNSIQKGRKYEDLFVLLKSPNLNSSILLTQTAKQIWKSERQLKCFIGIRYIGTVDGVFLSYPGITLNTTYDHRRRPWYQVAMANRQPFPSISVTFPYKDFFSGGEIISLAASVDKEFPGWSTPAAVLGGDFSVEFLAHQLSTRLPACNGTTVECFLIDNMGYIILHLEKPTFNKLHLTEIYQYMAKQLIQYQALTRVGCHDYEKDTIFLYWFFEMPFGETSAFFGRGNSRFVIHEIPFTNVFLVAKLATKVERISPISLKVCNSTCAQSPEPPCNVASTTDCTDRDNLRKRFSEMPACFPTDYSPDDKASKVCHNIDKGHTCFKADNEYCKLWKPRCI